MPGQPPVVSKCSFHFTACPPCKRTRFVPWVRPQRLSFPRLATRDAATRSLARKDPLRPLQAPQVHFNQNFLAHRATHIRLPPATFPRANPIPSYLPSVRLSHLSPGLIPKATALTPATLVPTLPLHAQDETTTLTAPPLRPFTGSQAGSTRPSGLCPAPNHIT